MAESLNILSIADKGVPGSGRLTYPNNLFESSTDYVKFTFYKYKGPFSGGSDTQTTDKSGKVTNGSTTFNIYNQAGQQFDPFKGVVPICLYMPEDVSTGYQTDWGGKGFTNVAANLLRGAGAGGSGDAGGVAQSLAETITRAGGALPTAIAESLVGAINALPGGLSGGNVTTQDLLQGSLGVILNPNTELMFNGFQMRQFSLRFKLAPRNLKEAKDIRNIIYTFKKVMLPSLGQEPGGPGDIAGNFKKLFGGGLPADTTAPANAGGAGTKTGDSNANYIGVPGLCQVQFMKGTNIHPYLPQFKICAITGVDVNYTPDGSYATYAGGTGNDAGSPVATELSLNFTETKLVYTEDIFSNGPSF